MRKTSLRVRRSHAPLYQRPTPLTVCVEMKVLETAQSKASQINENVPFSNSYRFLFVCLLHSVSLFFVFSVHADSMGGITLFFWSPVQLQNCTNSYCTQLAMWEVCFEHASTLKIGFVCCLSVKLSKRLLSPFISLHRFIYHINTAVPEAVSDTASGTFFCVFPTSSLYFPIYIPDGTDGQRRSLPAGVSVFTG